MTVKRDPIFEGAEKRFEITLDPGDSLRHHDLGFWLRFLEKIPAKVLSSLSNESCDAHLLSESSLFIFDRRLILITCGRTNLVPTAVELCRFLGLRRIRSLLYEREGERFPEHQPSTFAQDVALLNLCGPGETLRMEEGKCQVDLFRLMHNEGTPPQNDRLKMTLRGLRPKDRRISLHEIFPDFRIDEHVFEPTGYSLNAIQGDKYYTLHITPDEPGSYASFETNLGLNSQVQKGLNILLGSLNPQGASLLLCKDGRWNLTPFPLTR